MGLAPFPRMASATEPKGRLTTLARDRAHTVASYPPPPPAPMRERSMTKHSWPPPPAPGSIVPPPPDLPSDMPIAQERLSGIRPRLESEVFELSDGDLLEDNTPAIAPAVLTQAAKIGAAMLGAMLRARAVVVHSYDPASGMLHILAADGMGSNLLGTSCRADDDLVGSTILGNERSLKLRFDDGVPRSAPERLHRMHAKRSLLAVPVVVATGCVAIIEVVDADEALDAAEACERAVTALARCIGPRTSA